MPLELFSLFADISLHVHVAIFLALFISCENTQLINERRREYSGNGNGYHYLYRYQLMLNCWQQEPHDRPTFEQLRRELKLMENQHKVILVIPEDNIQNDENVAMNNS